MLRTMTIIAGSDVIRRIQEGERDGMAVRQIVAYTDPYYSEHGVASARPEFLIVFEYEMEGLALAPAGEQG